MSKKVNTEQAKQLRLTSPMCPSVNHYLGYRAIMRNGRPLAMNYKTKEATNYQKEFVRTVQKEAIKQKWSISSNPYQHYYMDCWFYFDRVDCDANNYFKCLADAITMSSVVWIDDNQLCERVQGIYYDPENPRIEIIITPVDYIGIFKNADELDAFEKTCVGCTRYKRNCRLLANAKQGRIQTEIQDGKCSGYKRLSKYSDTDVKEAD